MMTILHILCEGFTEEAFVKQVLRPYFQHNDNFIIKTHLLVTNAKKDKRGGLISYAQVKNDLKRTVQAIKNNANETHYVTTMLDFYALPSDFPAYRKAMDESNVYTRVERLEQAFQEDVSYIPHFIPYIQLHEFEALVFCGLDYLKNDYDGCEREIKSLKKVLAEYGDNPEAIDNHVSTAPSKRIIAAFKGKYQYNKPLSGVTVTMAVSLPGLRKRCRHFDQWLIRLEAIVPKSLRKTAEIDLNETENGFE